MLAVDWHVIWQQIFHPDGIFARALWTTVYIAVAAQLIGIVLGLVAALMRSSKIPPLRWLSGSYVLLFRGTPVLVQLYFIYFGVNLLFGHTLIPTTLHLGLFNLDGAVFDGAQLGAGPDPSHPLPTANFITQQDIAGEKVKSINAAVLRNAPPSRMILWGAMMGPTTRLISASRVTTAPIRTPPPFLAPTASCTAMLGLFPWT